jgi:hypothetical protein
MNQSKQIDQNQNVKGRRRKVKRKRRREESKSDIKTVNKARLQRLHGFGFVLPFITTLPSLFILLLLLLLLQSYSSESIAL